MSEPEQPAESLLVPAHRKRMISNNMTGERLASLFDMLVAQAETMDEPVVMTDLLWCDEDDPPLEKEHYIPQLTLVVQKVQAIMDRKTDLTLEEMDGILEESSGEELADDTQTLESPDGETPLP
jgi:hypothetical protein